MARTATLAQLRTDVLLRVDMVNSTFPARGEVDRYINQGITELYDRLIASGQDYYLASTTITTANGVDTYTLPANFYQVRGIDVNLGGQQLLTARRFNWEERNLYKSIGTGWYGGQPVQYDLRGNNVVMVPAPQGVYTLTLWYYPTAPTLSAETDTFDGVNGWDELIVLSSAIKLATREESYDLVATLKQDYAACLARVNALAPKRNAAEPPRVTDIRQRGAFYRRRIS